jgi:hypothetical protein
MLARVPSTLVIAAVLSLLLSNCGGSGAGSVGGGGGGGGGSSFSISVLAPSTVAVGVPTAGATILGQGFTQQSQVLIDGKPAIQTTFTNSSTLQVDFDISLNASTGVHQFSVQNGGQVSNFLPYTVYAHQPGPFVMEAIPGFLVAENLSDPTFIVAADINGDGLADVIMPGPGITNSESIAILNGRTDGTLAAPQYVLVPNTPYALAAGDVDGNGTVDLVSITSFNAGTSTASILLGDGHGNFQPPVTQQTFAGSYPGPAYLADLDGDGKLDLVLAVENNLLWLKNTGGALGPTTTLAAIAGDNRAFSIADFNGDGKLDILYTLPATATNPESLHILLNQGNGSFSDQAAGGLNGIVGMATVIDFNLDGIPDLVVQAPVQNSSTYELYSFTGLGNGSFGQAASASLPFGPIPLVAGDFDHDGYPDLAGPFGTEPSEIVYLFGDGHGNFTVRPVVGPEGYYVAVGDFNGDGIPDVVVPDRSNFVSLALGRKDRNFPSPLALTPATMTELSTGDINGDGLPEIFVGGHYDPIDGIFIPGTVFLNQGNSSFQLAASTDPTSFMVADLTGKGVVDLLGGATNLEIWPNNGTLDFSSSPSTLTQQTATIAVADMDGDGYPDIVSATGQVFYGNGAYRFTPITLASSNWGPYVVGDFNGDGKLDIATGSGTFLNTGNRTFHQVQANNLPFTDGVVDVVGDFNGDGKDDVALNLPGDTVISIYYSNGDGTFYQATVLDPGQYPGAMSVGDFNGDGKTDLAFGLLNSQQACIMFNGGNGEFTRAFFASGAAVVAMVTSDLNHNGKPDLVIGNFVLSYEPANVNVVFHQ